MVRDHLPFMAKIPCTNHSVHKSLCGERLPAERDQWPPDFVWTEPFTCKCTCVWDHRGVNMYLVVGLCKLGTTFCVNFEQQRCKISVHTAASALWLFGKWLPVLTQGQFEAPVPASAGELRQLDSVLLHCVLFHLFLFLYFLFFLPIVPWLYW